MDLDYLRDRERIMVRARWIVLATAAVLLQFHQVQARLQAPLWVAYVIIAVPTVYNLAAAAAVVRLYRPSLSRLLLLLDGLVATAGVAVSGGLRSPAVFFYLFIVITATRFFGLTGGILASAAAALAAAAVSAFLDPMPMGEFLWSLAIMAAPLVTIAAYSAYEFREEDRHRYRLQALNEVRGTAALVADTERLRSELEHVFGRVFGAETAEVLFADEIQPGYSAEPDDGVVAAGVWSGPLKVPGGCLGVIRVRGSRLRSEDAHLFRILVPQAAIIAHNAHLHRESQRLVRLEERERLCREFHDTFLNAVAGVLVRLAERARGCERLDCRGAAEVERLRLLLEQALTDLRRVIHAAGPRTAAEGLFGRLRGFAEEMGDEPVIRCSLEGDERYLSRTVAEETGKILREALINARRHAGARRIDLTVAVRPTALEAAVTDDGAGFDVAKAAGRGLGLGNMRRRAAGLGGRVDIESRPGRGTVVRLVVPLASEGAAAEAAASGAPPDETG